MQNDFAARADWCVRDYASANHHPVIKLRSAAQDIKARVGETVVLDASGSEDPDGDRLLFHWWTYAEAGTYAGGFSIDSNKARLKFAIPDDAHAGDTIHVTCQVSDDGSPALTRYRRIIIEVVE